MTRHSMIKPELAFLIFVTSNFAAPLLAFIAGRRWPHRRMAFHFLAAIWIVLSVYVCHKVTFTPDRAAVGDSYEPDEVIQFLVVGAVFLQQIIILAAYLVREVYRAVKKRREANRVARAFE
jgi:hypothetical protein